jgi:replicative DNA helicase Mcm
MSEQRSYDPADFTPDGYTDMCKTVLYSHRDPATEAHTYLDQAQHMLGKTVFHVKQTDLPDAMQAMLLTKAKEVTAGLRSAALALIDDMHPDYAKEIAYTLRLEMQLDMTPAERVTREQLEQYVCLEGRVHALDSVQIVPLAKAYQCQACKSVMSNRPRVCPDPECQSNDIHLYTEKSSLIEQRYVDLELDNKDIVLLSLTSDLAATPLTLSQRVRVTGIVDKAEVQTKQRIKGIEGYFTYLVVNSVSVTEQRQKLVLSDHDRQQYAQWAKDAGSSLVSELVDSFVPHIYGHDEIKEAVLYQIVSAEYDGNTSRPDIHIMLIGDASVGKSEIALAAASVAQGEYASGEGVKKAGIAAGLSKNESTGRWVVQAGIAVLGNGRLKCLDEIDKMNKDYLTQLYTVLDKGFYKLDAIEHAEFETKGAWLVTGNPKGGKYDGDKNLQKNLDFPVPLLTRFDLIFVMQRTYDREKTDKILGRINEQYNSKQAKRSKKDETWLAKYLMAAKEKKDLTILPVVFDMLAACYHKLEKAAQDIDSLPITERQYHGMLRLAIARARLHMRDTVEATDAERAIWLIGHMLGSAGLDVGANITDLNILYGNTAKSEKDKVRIVKTLLGQLTRSRHETISEDILVAEMLKAGRWSTDADAKAYLQTLRATQDIASPSAGWWCLGL